MKLDFSSLKLSEQDQRLYDMIFDVPLREGHPKRKLQQMFLKFAELFPLIDVETNDFYNNGGIVGFHFKGDAFIVLCDMDEGTIEVSILIDYENAIFEEIEENVKFDWNQLAIRLKVLQEMTDWQDVSTKEETIAIYRNRLREQQNELARNK